MPIQLQQESVRALGRRFGVSPTTLQRWRRRTITADAAIEPERLTQNSRLHIRPLQGAGQGAGCGAISVQAAALSIVASKSLASVLHRPSHAKVRSTTHRPADLSGTVSAAGPLSVGGGTWRWPARSRRETWRSARARSWWTGCPAPTRTSCWPPWPAPAPCISATAARS